MCFFSSECQALLDFLVPAQLFWILRSAPNTVLESQYPPLNTALNSCALCPISGAAYVAYATYIAAEVLSGGERMVQSVSYCDTVTYKKKYIFGLCSLPGT